MRAGTIVAIVLGVACVALGQPSLPTCCHDLDGVRYSDCTCIEDGTTLLNQNVTEGEYMRYHWILTDWSIINVPDDVRPEMTVEAAPCSGDVHLFVQGPSLQADPFPTVENALWNASTSYSPNAITFSLVAAQYFITVYGNNETTSEFSLAVQVDDAAFPTPGGNSTVEAVPAQTSDLLLSDDPISMDITFFTAETLHGNEDDYQYRVYFVPVIEGNPCGEDNVTATHDCILTTHCGAQSVDGVQSTEWKSFPGQGGENVTITVDGLVQDQEYTFAVAVQAPNGNAQMYTGTRGTPTYDRVGQAQSDTTIIAVAAGATALFVLLVGCIFFAKVRLNRAFQQRRATREYTNIAPEGTAAASAGAGAGAAAGTGVQR